MNSAELFNESVPRSICGSFWVPNKADSEVLFGTGHLVMDLLFLIYQILPEVLHTVVCHLCKRLLCIITISSRHIPALHASVCFPSSLLLHNKAEFF